MHEIIKTQAKRTIISRIIYFPLIQIIIAVILVNVLTFFLRSIAELTLHSLALSNATISSLIIFLVRLLSVYFIYSMFVKLFEKRKAEETAIAPKSVKQFLYGAAFGIVSIVLVITIMWLMGNFEITGLNSGAPLFQSFLYHTFFAFLQDVIYFAIIFRIMEKWIGSWGAIAIASCIFGFKHLLFPGYTLWSVITQSLEAGILFSTMFIFSRNIWTIFGFHVFWNFIQYGIIMGFSEEKLVPLFIARFTGSELITGMPVGPEASLITCCLLTSVGIYFLTFAYKKGYFVSPSWKR